MGMLGMRNATARPTNKQPIYVTPFDTGDETLNQSNRVAAALVAMNHGYILQLQIHKLCNLK